MPQMAITEAQAQQRLSEVAASRAQRDAEAAAAAEAARPKAVLPVDGARMTTCFCMRWGQMHYGIDLAAPMLPPSTRPRTAWSSGPVPPAATARPSTSWA